MKLAQGFLFIFILFCHHFSFAEDEKPTLKIFGPSGPSPAVHEAADAFAAKNNLKVEVTAGPSDKWKSDAQKDGDIIYTSSESMMDDFQTKLGNIDASSIQTMYLCPAVLLVRTGNPKKIKGLKDLLKKDVKVMVVNDDAHVALWEDVVGRLRDASSLKEFRDHISNTAPNSAEAEHLWKTHSEIDAWLTFNSWGKHTTLETEVIPLEKDLTIYRGFKAAVTSTTLQRDNATRFVDFMNSPEGEGIFKSWGWFRKEK